VSYCGVRWRREWELTCSELRSGGERELCEGVGIGRIGGR
jgi:hypothetical protein